MNWKCLMSSARSEESKKYPPSVHPFRSHFDKDYDRIIFSRPFRNLQDKTQVFPLPEQGFVHTRLTHSLEVASVAKSLGKNVGDVLLKKYPALVAELTPHDFGAVTGAAALAHDVGNPPFGHSGEQAISEYFQHNEKAQKIQDKVSPAEWNDLTHFEGNAQGFRLLTQGHNKGLNLTYATLAAFTKYPRLSDLTSGDPERKSQKKYGCFQSEKETFLHMAQHLGLVALSDKAPVFVRHPLAFLVEAADDICYSIIDLEDGLGLGVVSYQEIKNFLAQILQDDYQPQKLERLATESEKIGVLRAVAINRLIRQVSDLFVEREADLLNGSFDCAMTAHIPAASVLRQIITFSKEKIYQSRPVIEKEAAGFEIIEQLLTAFVEAVFERYEQPKKRLGKHRSVFQLLPQDMIQSLDQVNSLYEALMMVTDHVSGMTDRLAVKQYKTIKGLALV